MALSNAERQARHRERVKAKLRGIETAPAGPPDVTSKGGSGDIAAKRITEWLEQQIVAGTLDALAVDMIGRNAQHLALRYGRRDGGTRKVPLTDEQARLRNA